MSEWPKPSSRYAEYVRKLAACGHWKFAGIVGGDKAVLDHDGTTVSYGMHDGGNEHNGPRNFAAEAQKVCGCTFIQPRGRKRSRKKFSDRDPQVEAQRRKYRESVERKRKVESWCEMRSRFLEARECGDSVAAGKALRLIAKELAECGLTYEQWDRTVVQALRSN